MESKRCIPNPSRYNIVTYEIKVQAKSVDSSYQLLSISVAKEANRIPTAKLVLRDGEAALETFEISEKPDFEPGNKIEIFAGYDSDNKPLFKGIIIKHSLKIRENGQSEIHIECKDQTIRMTVGRHSRYFPAGQTDKQIMDSLIDLYRGIDKEVEATTPTHKELVQYHCSDWDFLLSRADINGKLVLVDDGKITVKAPTTSGSEEVSVLYGATILEFEGEMDARNQWSKVASRSWDFAGQSLATAETSSGPTSFQEHGNLSGATLAQTIGLNQYELLHSGEIPQPELQAWTDAAMIKSRLAKIRGRVKVNVGIPTIKPGKLIKLDGLGRRFNGKAYITGIRHIIGEGKWDVHIQFGLSPDWFAHRENIPDFPAGGHLPPIVGLQIGKVVKLENDPDGEHRIQVKIPVLDNEAEGIWARIACLDAGNERGTFFRPEIDDEVVLGFLQQDPRDPIVLGMLNSSNKPAPLVAQDVNHEKGIFTRSKMEIRFNDDTKTITIKTPAGNMITVDEAEKAITIVDQNKNKIEMNPDGINVNSPKKIQVEAGTDMNLKAQANLTIDATNITIKAKTQLNAEGASKANFKSSGMTQVKGSLVKIN